MFEVTRWTGLERHVLGALFDDLVQRVKNLGLKIEPDKRAAALQTIAILITTLATNYVNSGKFIE